MKAKNQENVIGLISTFSKIISMYNKLYDRVVVFYREFISTFGQTEVRVEKSNPKKDAEKFLKLDPDLFSGKYTRKCPKRPEIVSEEQANDLQNVMLYPKTPQEGTQRYYTCDSRDDEYKFVGLQRTDPIITKYNYVPCCFKKDQSKGNTLFNKYFKGVSERTLQQRTVVGSKFLDYNTYGELTEFSDISRVLTDPDPDFKFYRWGVDRSRKSFAQCIIEALKIPEYRPETEASRERSVYGILERIAADIPLLYSAVQSLFDKSISDIQDILLDRNSYLDPSLLIQLFETKFDCKIFVFSPSSLIIPRTMKSLLQTRQHKSVVFVLEHLGSDPAIASYPRCELIVRANRIHSDQVSFSLRDTNPVVQYISTIYDNMTRATLGTKQIKTLSIPAYIGEQLSGQVINSYGKTAALITRDAFILYLDSPIAPLPLPNRIEYAIHPYDVTMKYLTEVMRVRSTSDTILNDGKTTGITVSAGDLKFSIPVQPTDRVTDSQPTRKLFPNPEDNSVLATYNAYQKVAKYLREFIIYMFSEYLYKNKIATITDSVIERFTESSTVINPTIKYKIPSRYFSEVSKYLTRGDKLVLQSDELLNRLVFTLRLFISQRTQEVFEYHKRKSVENYITDLSDFEQRQQEIILEGKDSILKYIREKTSLYFIQGSISPLLSTPYFFKNINISETVLYIAVNTTTLDDAISAIHNWKKHKVINVFPTDTTPLECDVYVYNSEDDINIVSDNNSEFKIVGYLFNEEYRHTALIPF
jgi:hypothetical protein